MQLKDLINHPEATLIDVRESWELGSGRVEGALNIPLGQVFARVEELRELSKPVVLFCVSGNRSGMAMEFLKAQGVKEVYNGGSWQQVAALRESVTA